MKTLHKPLSCNVGVVCRWPSAHMLQHFSQFHTHIFLPLRIETGTRDTVVMSNRMPEWKERRRKMHETAKHWKRKKGKNKIVSNANASLTDFLCFELKQKQRRIHIRNETLVSSCYFLLLLLEYFVSFVCFEYGFEALLFVFYIFFFTWIICKPVKSFRRWFDIDFASTLFYFRLNYFHGRVNISNNSFSFRDVWKKNSTCAAFIISIFFFKISFLHFVCFCRVFTFFYFAIFALFSVELFELNESRFLCFFVLVNQRTLECNVRFDLFFLYDLCALPLSLLFVHRKLISNQNRNSKFIHFGTN